MTKPSLSWIDRDRMAVLLGRVPATGSPPSVAVPTIASAGLSSSTPRPSDAPATVVPGGAPSLRSERQPFHPPAGPIEGRLEAYLDWAATVAPSLASFVADDAGHTLASRCDNAALVAVTAACMAALEETRRALGGDRRGRMSLSVDGAGLLHLAEVDTAWGRFAVGVLTEGSIDERSMQRLQNGLSMALVE